MASVRSMGEKRIQKLESMVAELREALEESDFDELTKLADAIGEEADKLGAKFQSVAGALGDDEEPEEEPEEEEPEPEPEPEPTAKRRTKAKR